MKKLLFALPVVLLLAAGCNSNQQAGQQNQSANTQTQQQTNRQDQQSGSNQTANWRIYSNAKYNFELSYPSNWNITENESYITIKPTAKSESNFSIATVNIGRESVFDLAAKVKIQDTVFGGKKAKMYDCQQQVNGCPSGIPASVAIHLTDLPAGWGQWNEIDYEVYKNDSVNAADFDQILNSTKFTK